MQSSSLERWGRRQDGGAFRGDGSGLRHAGSVRATAGRRRSECAAVSAISRVVTACETRAVRIVGLSATTALVFSGRPIGQVGQAVDLFLPVVGNREICVTAGVQIVHAVQRGQLVLLHFMIPDIELRRQIDELLALLLAGELDLAARQPRVIYNVPMRYGMRGERTAHLEELALRDLVMRTQERLPKGARLELTIPALNGEPALVLEGRVTARLISRVGDYHTVVSLVAIDNARRGSLVALIADLRCG